MTGGSEVRQWAANLLGSFAEGVARTIIRESMPRVAFQSIHVPRGSHGEESEKGREEDREKGQEGQEEIVRPRAEVVAYLVAFPGWSAASPGLSVVMRWGSPHDIAGGSSVFDAGSTMASKDTGTACWAGANP